ncbi:MAG: hypothetical protein KGQ77_11750, partial [Betaproteobacteria bacterium]|nr:hypothetical protein [Betaproteobacteria bacterium]
HATLRVTGRAAPHSEVAVVVDGDVAHAQQVQASATGRWQATLALGDMIDAHVQHRVVAWSSSAQAASAARTFRAAPHWRLVADVPGRTNEARGPTGHYSAPLGTGWGDLLPLTLRRTRVWAAGGALKVALTMGRISNVWNPPNGFDHVAFTLFVQVPGLGPGLAEMPLQNARLPEGMTWNLRLRANGWTNALFSTQGASATHEGTAQSPGAQLAVDARSRTVTFTLPASALGNPATLAGVRLYATTWDYDGGYRPLTPQPGPGSFGGGDGARDALVMDETGVIGVR